jgi:glycosyltransferase involved in cell wall biosynthesis
LRPRICLFTDSLEPSGVGEHVLTLAAELGHTASVSVVCPPTEGGTRVLERAASLGALVLPLEVRGRTRSRRRLQSWLRAAGVEVFHAHAGIGWEGHDGVQAARAAGVPVVIRTEHLPNVITDQGQRRTYASMSRLVDATICVSRGVARSYVEQGLTHGAVRVVHNGIRPRLPGRTGAATRRSIGLPPDARLILSVGRLTAQKGHSDLIAALPTVLRSCGDAHLAIAGGGVLGSRLSLLAREAGVSDRVSLLGPRDDVPELIDAAEVVVLPSLFEGLPIVVLEAMALGAAVIGTRVCGMSEAIVDGETGRLVAPGRPSLLADAISEALRDDRLRASWGGAGRRRFARHFTAAQMAAKTRSVYREFAALAELRAAVELPSRLSA